MFKNTRNAKRIAAELADRRDLRNALIHRKEGVEKKIKAVEKQIHELTHAAA